MEETSSLPEASGSKLILFLCIYDLCSGLASLRLVDLNFTSTTMPETGVCLASLRLVDLNLHGLTLEKTWKSSSLPEASGSKSSDKFNVAGFTRSSLPEASGSK